MLTCFIITPDKNNANKKQRLKIEYSRYDLSNLFFDKNLDKAEYIYFTISLSSIGDEKLMSLTIGLITLVKNAKKLVHKKSQRTKKARAKVIINQSHNEGIKIKL